MPKTSVDMTASMKKTAMFMFAGDDAVAERQDEESQEGAAKGDVGAEAEEQLVGAGGDEVFLDEQLHAVGEGLQPAELAADARGAEAVLNAAGDLAFQPDEEDGGHRHEADQHRRGDHGDNQTVIRPQVRHGAGSFSQGQSVCPGPVMGVTLCSHRKIGKRFNRSASR